jgi:hypothetical protein
MANIQAVRDGLETRLRTIPGLRVPDTVAGTINPPAAIITLGPITYDSSMSRGSDDVIFEVSLFSSLASDRVGEASVYAYVSGSGAQSVKAAIEGDARLGGAAMYAVVTEARAPGFAEYGGVEYYAVQFVISVSVDGL